MNLLLAESNIYLTSFITFVVIMAIVGFFVMRADKKRWNMQVARSQEMQARKKKKKDDAPAEETAQDAAATADEEAQGKKKKKKEKKIPEGYVDGRTVKSDPSVYKGLISDKILFTIAICFGGLGELIAMIVYRHRWYKWSFRAFIPASVVLNIVVAALICLLISAKSGSGILSN